MNISLKVIIVNLIKQDEFIAIHISGLKVSQRIFFHGDLEVITLQDRERQHNMTSITSANLYFVF